MAYAERHDVIYVLLMFPRSCSIRLMYRVKYRWINSRSTRALGGAYQQSFRIRLTRIAMSPRGTASTRRTQICQPKYTVYSRRRDHGDQGVGHEHAVPPTDVNGRITEPAEQVRFSPTNTPPISSPTRSGAQVGGSAPTLRIPGLQLSWCGRSIERRAVYYATMNGPAVSCCVD